MKNYLRIISTFSLLLLYCSSYSQSESDELLKGFVSPPNAAKPIVWWHWMNGNVAKEGIAKDLLWMKRIGIGGFQTFEIGIPTPQVVGKRLIYMSTEWKDAFQFTTKLADSLQLSMGICSAPGWGENGGPWVLPSDGMKKLVWSEICVEGDKPFSGKLPNPPTTSGVFQNLSHPWGFIVGGTKMPPQYYKDIFVVAYRLPEADLPLNELNPIITSSGGRFNLAQLSDGDIASSTLLPSDTITGFAWIQFKFEKPQTVKALTIVGGGDRGPWGSSGLMKEDRSLEVSSDGIHFKKVCYIPVGGVPQQTINIPVTTSRFFRITFKNPKILPNFGAIYGIGGEVPKAPAGTEVAEIVLHSSLRINMFEEKAGFATPTDTYKQIPATSDEVISVKDVFDISDKLKADGTLNWTPPMGKWKIVRFGYSLTGRQVYPAPLESTGLEADKCDSQIVKVYFEKYLDQYKKATGGLIGEKGGLQSMVTDSWEAGVQNWTNNMINEFSRRRGYNMLSWMPVLTGHIVKSSEESESFLWDFRKTLSELVAEYHYGQLATILHQHGMKLYSESHESGRAFIADGMDVKHKSDIPTSAIWTGNEEIYRSDLRESASVAHIYGQNLVAAESFTTFGNARAFSPERLKPTADMALANGLNRFVIHSSIHQPAIDMIPGISLGPYGQWFNRNETWAEQAIVWTSYLARSSYMMQQGKYVADVIYYYGEDNNITNLFGNKLPDIPEGYDFDFVNSDALLNLLSVNKNLIVTPSGMRYQVLALDSNSNQMTLKVANKIRELVMAGAVVVGPKPTNSPGLCDDKKAFNKIVNELWSFESGVKTFGNGKVFTGKSIKEVLKTLKIAPDFQYTKSSKNTELLCVHRKLPSRDFYWVNNRKDQIENIVASFRITGKSVEIWHPETGKVEQASYSFTQGRTNVHLHLEPNDALFVVFTCNSATTSRTIPQPKESELTIINGKWNLNFQKDRGAPDEIVVDNLASWTDFADTGIKYFSGTATYTKIISAPGNWFKKDTRMLIDLGEIYNIAEVIVNDKTSGIAWKKPYRVDITDEMKVGQNKLTIKVTNLWVNRLIGDQQLGITKKYTFTTWKEYNTDSPLLPSGLVGPVRILNLQKL